MADRCLTKDEFKALLKHYVKFYNQQRPCWAIGYDTPGNYRRRYNNGELTHKNTFEKREFSTEPKFVRKRRLQAHPEDIDETMSTFGNGNGLKRQEMSTFVNQKTPKLLPVSTIKNINH